MRRRAFSRLIAIGAIAWPFLGRAQMQDRVRRVGILFGAPDDDPLQIARVAAFEQGLRSLGWNKQTLSIDVRWTRTEAKRASDLARELIALRPDVIVSYSTPATAALMEQTKTIPVVFLAVSDPVGSGFVKSLARPGGNATGFINFESSLVGKWLQVLKQIAPKISQAGVMFNPETATYVDYYFGPLNEASSKLGVRIARTTVRSDTEIDVAIAGLARQRNSGLITISDSFMVAHRKMVIASAAKHSVPAVYFADYMVEEGGLISYGIDAMDIFRRAAPYVDQILRGTKPTEFPVQQPSKFNLVINRKTASALHLNIPPHLLQQADRIIE